jgi:hypothetical protein
VQLTFNIGAFGNVPHWTTRPEDCDRTYAAWGELSTLVIAPGCNLVFQALAADLNSYKQAVETLLKGPFAVETMAATLEEHAAFIRESVGADPNGPGIAAFESAVAMIQSEIPKLRMRLSAIINGENWEPLEIDVEGVTDFERQGEAGLVLGPQLYKNQNTDVTLSLDGDSPISGEKSLRISFEFDDDENPWEQWMTYVVGLKGGQRDMKGLSAIRMWVRADGDRTLRVELDNIYASSVNGWLREGWDIPVTSEPMQVEVLFQDAAIPGWAVSQGLEPVADLGDVLTSVKGVLFAPQCVGRDGSGFLPDDTKDIGFVEVDDIEFF